MTPSSSSALAGPAPWGVRLSSEMTMTTVDAREHSVSPAPFSEFCTQTQSGLVNAPISQTRNLSTERWNQQPGAGSGPSHKTWCAQEASPAGAGTSFTRLLEKNAPYRRHQSPHLSSAPTRRDGGTPNCLSGVLGLECPRCQPSPSPKTLCSDSSALLLSRVAAACASAQRT